MNARFPTMPLSLREARAHYRYLYQTEPVVTELIDHLVSQTIFPQDISNRYGGDTLLIAHEFWLLGWVVFANDQNLIYDPDDLVISQRTVDYGIQIQYNHGGIIGDITTNVTYLARRFSPLDIMGHSAIEALISEPTLGDLTPRTVIEDPLRMGSAQPADQQRSSRRGIELTANMVNSTVSALNSMVKEKQAPLSSLPGKSRFEILKGQL